MPPAARMGDPTVHGGVVTSGYPKVLIGMLPAARTGDAHTCPLVNGVVPHVGGVIGPGSVKVFIGGQPAARVGDQCPCAAGGPNTIGPPAQFKVIIN